MTLREFAAASVLVAVAMPALADRLPFPETGKNFGIVPPAPTLPQRDLMVQDLVKRATKLPVRVRPTENLFRTPFGILGDVHRAPGFVPPHRPYQGQSKLIGLMGNFPSGTTANYAGGYTNNDPRQYFQDLLFGTVDDQGNPWTMRNFYYDSSYGILELTGDVYGPYTVSQPYSYYTGGGTNYGFGMYPANAAGYAVELIMAHQLANPNFDWTQYDADQNGQVDGVFIMHPGRGAEAGGGTATFWSHFWSLDGAGVPGAPLQVGGGEAIGPYSCDPEYEWVARDHTVGVYVHEVMHNFGMTDVYNRQYTCGGGAGIWSTQAGGGWLGVQYGGDRPGLVDPWNASLVGWVNPVVPKADIVGAWIAPRNSTPGPMTAGRQLCYKLWWNGEPEGEYFLVENRVATGWDEGLQAYGYTGPGAIVWHIDEAYFRYGVWNDDCSHPFNAVEEADAGQNRQTANADCQLADGYNMRAKGNCGNDGDDGDAFPGPTNNFSITEATHPSTRSYYDVDKDLVRDDSYVRLRQIRLQGNEVLLDIHVVGPPKFVDTDPNKFRVWPNPYDPNRARNRTLHWGPVPKGSWMNVFSISGERVSTQTAAKDGFNEWVNVQLGRGVYAYRVTTPQGKTVKGTFAVVTK